MHAQLLREDAEMNSSLVRLYIERNDFLLSESKNLQLGEIVMLLRAILPALRLLIQKYRPFMLTDRMIHNCNGKWKIWIHSNIIKNEP
jgi:hypothetical protein